MSETLARALCRARYALAALVLLAAAAAAWQAARVGVDNSLRIWFLDDDPYLVGYRSYQESFGSDEVVVVAFRRAGGMAGAAGLELLRRAGARIGALPGVSGVASIADGSDARLLSRDGATAALVARMAPGEDARRDTVLRDIEGALAELGEPHHLAGIGVLYVALNRLSMIDASALFCAAVLVMLALLWLVYRRFATALLTIATGAIAMVGTLGLYGAAGRDLNMVTSAMPTVILVVAVANMVHVVLYGSRLGAASREARAVAALRAMLRPCTLNMATSAAGFAALAFAPLPAVRDLGLFTAAGLLACLPLVLLGAALALGAARCEPRAGGFPGLRGVAGSLCALGLRRPLLVLAGAAALSGAAALGASRLVVDTFTLEFIAPGHPVRRASALIEAELGPYVPMDFLVRAADGGRRPALIEALEDWQRAGERLPGVGWSRSPADGGFEPRVAADGALRVTFSVRMQSAKDVARTMQRLLEAADMPAGVSVRPAGYLPLYVRMIDYIVESQMRGFAFAFLVVFGIIAAAFRSARLALLAVPSNLLPLLFILGAMGAAGIRLDAATVTIATVVLGLVVDDTVHFLDRLREALREAGDPREAVRAAAASAGHAILTTALVMTAGFAVFALSQIRSLLYFGLLIALALATSVLVDLLLIPALVARTRLLRC